MKKTLLISLAVVGLLICGAGAIRAWRSHVVARAEARAYEAANRSLQEGRPLEALAIADEQPRTDRRFPWSTLELSALTTGRQMPRLIALFEREPDRVLSHEDACLLVARVFFAARQAEPFARVRDAWRARETQPHLWLALDSDRLALEGKPAEAEALLRSRQFAGEAEAARLVRLSLYAAPRNLHEAWTLLDQAATLAPRNTEIRSFRAQILETIGKAPEARVEYVAAHVADPRNPLLRDELAEFYRRQGSLDPALETWRDALATPAPDFLWLKEGFWSRVVQPAAATPDAPRLASRLGPFAAWVRTLPAGQFWDDASFQQLPNADRLERDRPEAFWLHLIELLRTGQEPAAARLLQGASPRLRSLDPDLATALARILQFRTQESFALQDASGRAATNRHQLFVELDRLARAGAGKPGRPQVAPDFAQWLRSTNALAGAFLAAGWREAALALAGTPDDAPAPSWFAYGFAQCLRFNRGNAAALAYLERQPSAPEVSVLKAELLLANHQVEDGLRALAALATQDSDAGFRAAWLLAQARMERQDYAAARDAILRQPRLARSATGREQLARLALLTGNETEAESLYRAIETESVEARAYLARRAFARKDWAAARQQTEALMRLMPDQLQLRENLIAIGKAEQTNAAR